MNVEAAAYAQAQDVRAARNSDADAKAQERRARNESDRAAAADKAAAARAERKLDVRA
ncbi:MAG: hypothetical protein ABL996_02080 [Micropepsaceae bacterium]